jgi:hypothetical protein
MTVLQLLELQFKFTSFLLRLVPDREFKTELVKLRFPFNIHSAIFKDESLLMGPTAKLWVKAVNERHLTYNTGREESRVLV